MAAGADPSTAVIFSLPIVTSFEYVVFTTGAQQFVVTTAGVNTNLGLSSGCISTGTANQQRWMAQPFSVPATASMSVKPLAKLVAEQSSLQPMYKEGKVCARVAVITGSVPKL